MSFKTLKRDNAKLISCIKTIDHKEVALEDLFLYVPARFKEVGLLVFGKQTKVYGSHALVTMTGEYAVRNINALLPISPKVTKRVKVDGIDYYQFYFPKNTVMTLNTVLVKEDTLIYFFMNELFFVGKIPSYYTYEDMGKVLRTAKKHAGSEVGTNNKTIELLVAYQARQPNNPQLALRHQLKPGQRDPSFYWAPLKSVQLSAKGTANKMVGNYMYDGMISALAQKENIVTPVEKILRA